MVKLLRVNDERKEVSFGSTELPLPTQGHELIYQENIKIVKAELLKMGAMKKEILAMKAEIAELKK